MGGRNHGEAGLCLLGAGALQPKKPSRSRLPLTRQRRRQLSYSMPEMLGIISACHASIYCL